MMSNMWLKSTLYEYCANFKVVYYRINIYFVTEYIFFAQISPDLCVNWYIETKSIVDLVSLRLFTTELSYIFLKYYPDYVIIPFLYKDVSKDTQLITEID